MPLADEGKAITYRETFNGAVATSNVIQLWTPPRADGLVAQMDIRQGLTKSGTAVTGWASQVGGLVASQGFAINRPSAPGSDRVVFGGDDFLSLPGVPTAPVSRTYVGLANFTGGITGLLFGTMDHGGYCLRRIPSGQMQIVSGGVGSRAHSATTWTAGQDVIVTARFSPSGWTFRRNGAVESSGVPSGGFAGSGTMDIGRMRDGNFMVGAISSHLVYDAALGDDELARAEGWLAWTLGKQSLLTAGHPYAHVPPLT